MARQTRTDAERAQEAFDTNHRLLTRARTRRDKSKTEYEDAQAAVEHYEARRDFLASDPDLPPAQNVDTYGTDTQPPASDWGAADTTSSGA